VGAGSRRSARDSAIERDGAKLREDVLSMPSSSFEHPNDGDLFDLKHGPRG